MVNSNMTFDIHFIFTFQRCSQAGIVKVCLVVKDIILGTNQTKHLFMQLVLGKGSSQNVCPITEIMFIWPQPPSPSHRRKFVNIVMRCQYVNSIDLKCKISIIIMFIYSVISITFISQKVGLSVKINQFSCLTPDETAYDPPNPAPNESNFHLISDNILR